jgi:hypothetical protein
VLGTYDEDLPLSPTKLLIVKAIAWDFNEFGGPY